MTFSNVDFLRFQHEKVTAMCHTWQFPVPECSISFSKSQFSIFLSRYSFGNVLHLGDSLVFVKFSRMSYMTFSKHRHSGYVRHAKSLCHEFSRIFYMTSRNIDFQILHRETVSAMYHTWGCLVFVKLPKMFSDLKTLKEL